MSKKKNPAAVALGRLGGSKKHCKPRGFAAMTAERLKKVGQRGGESSTPTKGFGSMTPERRKEIAALGGKKKAQKAQKKKEER
jgi:hypothetical protein